MAYYAGGSKCVEKRTVDNGRELGPYSENQVNIVGDGIRGPL